MCAAIRLVSLYHSFILKPMEHDKHDKIAASSSLKACMLPATSMVSEDKGGDSSHGKGGPADCLAGLGSHHIHHRAAPPATHSARLHLQSTSLNNGPGLRSPVASHGRWKCRNTCEM